MTTKVIKDRYALRKEINEYLDQFDYEDMHDAWQKISRDPWLFDKDTSVEEAMILKLKNKCPRCGLPSQYHSEDCEYSMNQLMFRELESSDRGLIYFTMAMGELISKQKELGDK